jgi:DNA invertase Pin-like site-specific DNA recombinase
VKVVAYCRVSTAGQVKDGLGLKTQERLLHEWARQQGHVVVAVCAEGARSGTLPVDRRPKLVEAMRLIRAGRAEALVATSIDRLARELHVQEAVLAQVWSARGHVFTLDNGGSEVLHDDPDDPMRTAMRQMAGVFAQLERATIIKRLRAGRATKRANGGFAGGGVVYGKRVVEGELVEDPDEARMVARVHELRAQGASYRQVCEALTAEEHKPRRALSWSPMTVRGIARRTA